MRALLYILLGVSILAPIYTYVLYPIVLRLLKQRSRKALDNYYPSVSVIIIGGNINKSETKRKYVEESDYPNIVDVFSIQDKQDIVFAIRKSKGDTIVVTDEDSIFQKETISNVIRPLSEPLVGCVSGMVRKRPNENGEFCDGSNWIYENRIKVLESNIGCLSGANSAIYAFKKELAPNSIDQNINLDFYIPTVITEGGFDVLFEPKAVAYESTERTEDDLFKKHVTDGVSGYCSILRFWRLLLPHKGSFVFWSHRVMKWLVPFNLIIILIACFILSFSMMTFLIFTLLQIIGYLIIVIYAQIRIYHGGWKNHRFGSLLEFFYYFLTLQTAWLYGFLKLLRKAI